MSILPLLDWFALAGWMLLWLGYQWFALVPRFGRHSLSTVMVPIRRRWMLEALQRENRISDASLIGNLMNSATFFSSTTLLILGGLFAFISSIDENAAFVSNLPFAGATTLRSLEFKFVILAFVFIYALFRFLWSIRQFNLLTILLGAFPAATRTSAEQGPPDLGPVPADDPSQPRLAMTTRAMAESPMPLVVDQATRLNALAGNNFTQALRAYYYAVPVLLWLINPWLLIAGSVVVTSAVYFTEYRSDTARALCDAPPAEPFDGDAASPAAIGRQPPRPHP